MKKERYNSKKKLINEILVWILDSVLSYSSVAESNDDYDLKLRILSYDIYEKESKCIIYLEFDGKLYDLIISVEGLKEVNFEYNKELTN